MNQSKNGLNDSFYKWCDDVRRALTKLKEYEEKLTYYEMKLIGYKSISFDEITSRASKTLTDETIIFWMDKINELEIKHKKSLRKLKEFDDLLKILSHEQREYLRYMINYESCENCSFNENKRKRKHAVIVRKWFNLFQRNN